MHSRSDPAGWSSASETPDFARGIDSLEDLVAETANAELSALPAAARSKIVPVIARVSLKAIAVATQEGLLHNEDTVTWTKAFREIVARLLAEIMEATNPRLITECMDFVFGTGIQMGISEQAIADKHGMTRSNVSKLCVGLCDRYQVPPSRGMKSENSRDVFRNRQIGRRAKHQPEPWAHNHVLLAAFHAHATAA